MTVRSVPNEKYCEPPQVLATWAEMHTAAAEGRQEQLAALRKCTSAGCSFGDDEAFVAAMEGRFQRRSRRSAADLEGEVAMSA